MMGCWAQCGAATGTSDPQATGRCDLLWSFHAAHFAAVRGVAGSLGELVEQRLGQAGDRDAALLHAVPLADGDLLIRQ